MSTEVQQAAAQYNNRGFIHKCLEKMLAENIPAVQDSPSLSSISEASVDYVEMTAGQPFEEEAPFELNNPSASHFEQQQIFPFQQPAAMQQPISSF